MNKLSTLPVGYKPTNLGQIRTHCVGNNGYFTKGSSHLLDYDWTTTDKVVFSKGDGSGSGVGVKSQNIFASSMSSGWRINRLGNKSARNTFFYGDLNGISSSQFTANGTSSFIAHAIGITFKFSKADTRTTRDLSRKQNTQTECRIQKVAGVYVSPNSNNIYSYTYGTVGSGSLGFNASGIDSNDKFCCYLLGSSTYQSNVHTYPLLLIGWLFDLNFNHNGTGEQNPSGQFWQARPVISLSGHGNTNKPDLMLAYPFETTKWSDANPKNSGKMLKFNQARV